MSIRFAYQILGLLTLVWTSVGHAQYEQGQQITTAAGQSFTLEKLLGAGDFGQAWTVRGPSREHVYVVKLYHDAEDANDVRKRYEILYSVQKGLNFPPSLLQLDHPSSVVIHAKEGKKAVPTTAVFSEAVDGSLRQFATDYQWPQAERSERALVIKRLFDLLHDTVAGLNLLHELGVSHMDITPNNIFVDGTRHKLGDLDSTTPSGLPPGERAWEAEYAAIEYSHFKESTEYRDSPLGDAWSLGVVLYELLTGEKLLTSYLRTWFPAERLQDEVDPDIWMLRDDMNLNLRSRAYEPYFSAHIAHALEDATEKAKGLSSISQNQLNVLTAYIEAALTLDVKDRKAALAKAMPTLRLGEPSSPICGYLRLQLRQLGEN